MSPKPKKRKLADCADRHKLYEQSVQDADTEVEFLKETFQNVRGRAARSLREDFCGTATVACKWVEANWRHTAIGVDLDPEVLDWGRKHNLAKMSEEAQQRVQLIQGNVLESPGHDLDIVTAMNFSYWIFKERASLLRYFCSARAALAADGLFLIDVYGGSDAYETMNETRKVNGFTYVWEQADYDPVSGHAECHIHFRFKDGSRLRRAFSYQWRLWSLPEIRELLEEAGFSKTTVLWQGTDEETGEGNGEFLPVERGENDPAWIAYVQAEP